MSTRLYLPSLPRPLPCSLKPWFAGALTAALLSACAAAPKEPAAPAAPRPAETPVATQQTAAPSAEISAADLDGFARDLAVREQLPQDAIRRILADIQYSATVARLIAPAPPERKVWRSWQTYRSRFVEPKRIKWGMEFWRDHADLLKRAEQRYGVPASIIVSIIGVETLYGRNMGDFRVLNALGTLAFHYPEPAKPERVQMFRGQLADFIAMVLRGKMDLQATGSYAGAIGMPQFMPGSILRYAVDGDGDGRIDLTHSVADAVMSVGNFLQQHGWRPGLPVFAPVTLPADPAALVAGGLEPTLDWPKLQAAGATTFGASYAPWQGQLLGVVNLDEELRHTAEYRTATPNFFVITQYNRSYFYATAVSDLADAIAQRR